MNTGMSVVGVYRCVYGVSECDCDVGGTVGWSGHCHVVSGQCQCRPFVNNRRCDECVDGAYNLQQHNAFGCQRMSVTQTTHEIFTNCFTMPVSASYPRFACKRVLKLFTLY